MAEEIEAGGEQARAQPEQRKPQRSLFGRRKRAGPPAAPDAAYVLEGVPAADNAAAGGSPAEGAPAPLPGSPAAAEVTLTPPEPTPIPELPPHRKEVMIYPVQAPFAFVRIAWDEESHENIYEVIEPPLTDREKRVLEFVESTMVDILEIGLGQLDDKQAEALLRKNIDNILYDYNIQAEEPSKSRLTYYVVRDFLGFGKIDPIMRDDLIEDISCDGPSVPIFLYHRKYESVRSAVQLPTDEELDSFVIRLAQRSGKHISIAEPLLDATMPDGSRLNATLSDEVTSGGSTFTIRKFRKEPFTPTDLVKFGTMSADMLAYLWMAVQHGASTIYAGGTASGKTTSLNAILLFIPPQMKIVSIEDTRELSLPHPNWIAATTRSGFGPRDDKGRQAGEIDMFTLLKAALRQRPEYILVGEVRGQEAYVLFQAMATGHSAYGTMHADSVEGVIHRLESEPINIPRSLLEALDIVSVQIQTRIAGKRVRRTKEIVEVVGLDPHTHEILTNEVFTWQPGTDKFEFSGVSYVLERIRLEKNMTEPEMKEELDRRKEIIEWMMKHDVRDHRDVAKIILGYYRDQEGTMERIRAPFEPLAPVPVPTAVAGDSPPPEGPTAPAQPPMAEAAAPAVAEHPSPEPSLIDLPSVDPDVAMRLLQAGYRSVGDLRRASVEDLGKLDGVGLSMARKIKQEIDRLGGRGQPG